MQPGKILFTLSTCSLALIVACADDTSTSVGTSFLSETSLTTLGDGDGDTGESNGMSMSGDGDGDGDPSAGDGDGDPSAGDGDGDPSAGDGDGDPTAGDGDGDGDPTAGDGDGDGDTNGDGDGDGDTNGDGDGDTTGDGDGESTDTDTGTTGGNEDCQAPADYADCDGPVNNLVDDPFQAMGINCGNDPASTVIAANTVMNSNNANAWRVMSTFGTAAGANYNNKLWAANDDVWINPDMEEIPSNTSTAILMVSTGIISQVNNQGVVTEAFGSQQANGDNQNPDMPDSLPAPMSPLRGSNNGMGGTPFMNCDLINDCSDSLYNHWVINQWDDPNDKLWMSMNLTVPAGTEGYIFDFAYFSSEWPGYINTVFNDLFIAWSTSETYTGNITFVNGAPLTITSLDDVGAFQYTNNSPQLAGTGFEGHAGTGWYVARGSAAPEEQFSLTFFISDMADSILATGVLLDNFRWECAGCVPNELNSCGIQPQ
jgi:hypothetical protein